jgi:putative tricarboxylic transport membrane protein
MRSGHAADLVIGLAFAGLGTAIIIIASGFRELPGMAVGSGLFPRITGIAMLGFGLLLALAAARAARRGPPDGEPPVAEQVALVTPHAVAVVVSLCLLLAAMPAAGFLASGFVFCLFLVRLGGGGWTGALSFAGIATALVFVIFTYGLRVPLPRGMF